MRVTKEENERMNINEVAMGLRAAAASALIHDISQDGWILLTSDEEHEGNTICGIPIYFCAEVDGFALSLKIGSRPEPSWAFSKEYFRSFREVAE